MRFLSYQDKCQPDNCQLGQLATRTTANRNFQPDNSCCEAWLPNGEQLLWSI